MAKSPPIPSISEARGTLRSAGLRATPCRIAVVQFLAGSPSPVSHQEACQELESRGFDKSTIFRTLNDLTESGLAHRMELGDHVWRYELTGCSDLPKGSQGMHPHLLCTDCGGITCLSADKVRISIPQQVGAVTEILLKGRCRQCLEN